MSPTSSQGIALLAPILLVGALSHITFDRVILPIQMRKRLAGAASTPQLLDALVKPLGAVFEFPDGQWLAIDYQDRHQFPGRSLAVALDGTGRHYQSRRHFCGRFHVYRAMQKSYQEAEVDPVEIAEDLQAIDPEVYRLETAPNLAAARAVLCDIGFSESE